MSIAYMGQTSFKPMCDSPIADTDILTRTVATTQTVPPTESLRWVEIKMRDEHSIYGQTSFKPMCDSPIADTDILTRTVATTQTVPPTESPRWVKIKMRDEHSIYGTSKLQTHV
jgi:hypothetical protein